MLGLNKMGKTQRLGDTGYTDFIPSIKFRIQPIKLDSETWFDTSSHRSTYILQCNPADIILSDRVIYGINSYVVFGKTVHSDALWQHLTIHMRQIASENHNLVIFKTLDVNQDFFDPLLNEYTEIKTYTEFPAYVLIDPVTAAANNFIKIVDSWKLEEIDRIMEVDLPQQVSLSDRVMLYGDEYEIKWRVQKPYQTIAGLKKSFTNYAVPNG